MSDSDERAPETIEAAMRFLHAMGMQTKNDVHENAATLYALLEELIARGVVDMRTYEERRARARGREEERARSNVHVALDVTPDKYALTELPKIDCEARIPLCKAKCCTLVFALSKQDLDERVVEWDYGRPYQIRQRADGYCTHNIAGTGGCSVYQHRPSVCRTYDCRNDKRIWRDFENRIVAE
jgi:Fe-S-cluster containining protein